ncbi:putative glucuronosyltransferase PGSIP7 [Glycine max]|nr:putative glucuronosyltransferase PGSIP7 [Glycine max]
MVDDDALVVIGHSRAVAFTLHQSDVVQEERLGDDDVQEDGAKVVRVENMDNPYKHQDSFDKRFKLSLNKLYAWSLVDYDRIVMLDADNLFLQNTDELFQCGQFCAVFINPCVFHTGLSVLQILNFAGAYPVDQIT